MKNKLKILNATNLKLLAFVLMYFDHVYDMFYSIGIPIICKMLGRVVFPLLLFLSADSFFYTKSRYKYIRRLLIASWIMTISTFIIQNILPNSKIILNNNAFSTFFLTAIYLQMIELIKSSLKNKDYKKVAQGILIGLIPMLFMIPSLLVPILPLQGNLLKFFSLISLLLPNFIIVEGTYLMVLLGISFYIFRKHRLLQILFLILFSLIFYFQNCSYQWMMVFASIPILLYNDKKGSNLKYFFYIFYPLHIIILYIISTIFIQ